jgi:fido (protein-threonine AMPylation protein)/DNA-binding Lrp family transcriptional regulator
MTLSDQILRLLQGDARRALPWLSSTELAEALPASLATIKRQLEVLLRGGQVVREGQARATRYRLATYSMPTTNRAYLSEPDRPPDLGGTAGKLDTTAPASFPISPKGQALLRRLKQPLGLRNVVGYDRDFVDQYVPNQTCLLPSSIADSLAQRGRLQGQQPAGTYARKVLGPLLIDLSWSSSRLEGNRYSLLATEELFRSGRSGINGGGDPDAVMLLNHKAAIEFMIDAVPEFGLTSAVVQNLHAILMQDLLADAGSLGAIRQRVVNIRDTAYVPLQSPLQLSEMFDRILEKARLIKNPVEAAFFLWVNLAYLQPFEDGNKRTSRLAANIPLMLYNGAPLSFLDIEACDYAYAVMAIYEYRDVSLAVDLFVWAYERSISKYAVQRDAMGVPDPIRLRFRESLNEVIGSIVRDGLKADEAIAASGVQGDDVAVFRPLLIQELQVLDLHNCARYRLTLGQVRQWIAAGRPW